MKKEDIQYEVTELARISNYLRFVKQEEAVKARMLQLYSDMCDLMAESDYSDAAESIIQGIEMYNKHKMSKEEVIGKVEALIEKMQEDLSKPEETSKIGTACKEIRTVLGNVAGIISREAKKAWKDSEESLKAKEMPECAEAIARVKKIPKRLEKNLKTGIKNWLNEDE